MSSHLPDKHEEQAVDCVGQEEEGAREDEEDEVPGEADGADHHAAGLQGEAQAVAVHDDSFYYYIFFGTELVCRGLEWLWFRSPQEEI